MTENEIKNLKENYEKAEEISEKIRIGKDLYMSFYTDNNYLECRKYATEVSELCLKENNIEFLVNANLRNGITHAIEGNQAAAIELFKETLEIAKNNHYEYGIANSYSALGASYYNTSVFHEALDCYKKSADSFDKVTSQDIELLDSLSENKVVLYNNISMIFSSVQRYEDALIWLNKALNENSNISKQIIYFTLGTCHKYLNNFPLAIFYYQKSLTLSKEINDLYNLNLCYQGIAEIYYKKRQYNKALPYLIKSYNFFDENNIDPEKLSVIADLVKIYVIQKKYSLAKPLIKKGFKISKHINNDGYLNKFYLNYSQFCYATGKYKEAYEYNDKSYILNNKIFDDNLLQKTAILTAQFDSEQKAKDLEIFRLNNVELALSQKMIERKNEELVNTNEMKDNILSMISHDLKNYIGAAISAYDIFILREPALIENKYIKIIHDANEKALTLVKDILYMNKMDIDENTIELSKQDINSVILDLIDNLALMAKSKSIDLICQYHPENLMCMLNKDKFHRIIDNLVINAIKFTHRGGKIIIKTQKIGNMAQIHIIDNGIGMEKSQIEKLFTQYSKTGRKGTDGEDTTGLGLYIVKTLLDRHGATIDVFSEIGKGSEFVIKLTIEGNKL